MMACCRCLCSSMLYSCFHCCCMICIVWGKGVIWSLCALQFCHTHAYLLLMTFNDLHSIMTNLCFNMMHEFSSSSINAFSVLIVAVIAISFNFSANITFIWIIHAIIFLKGSFSLSVHSCTIMLCKRVHAMTVWLMQFSFPFLNGCKVSEISIAKCQMYIQHFYESSCYAENLFCAWPVETEIVFTYLAISG